MLVGYLYKAYDCLCVCIVQDTRDLISSSDSDSSDDGRHAPRTKRQPQIKPPSKWLDSGYF